MSSTTFRLAGERKLMAEAVAVAISNKIKKPVKTSEVVHFVIDKYLTPAIAEQFVREYQEEKQ